MTSGWLGCESDAGILASFAHSLTADSLVGLPEFDSYASWQWREKQINWPGGDMQ